MRVAWLWNVEWILSRNVVGAELRALFKVDASDKIRCFLICDLECCFSECDDNKEGVEGVKRALNECRYDLTSRDRTWLQGVVSTTAKLALPSPPPPATDFLNFLTTERSRKLLDACFRS